MFVLLVTTDSTEFKSFPIHDEELRTIFLEEYTYLPEENMLELFSLLERLSNVLLFGYNYDTVKDLLSGRNMTGIDSYTNFEAFKKAFESFKELHLLVDYQLNKITGEIYVEYIAVSSIKDTNHVISAFIRGRTIDEILTDL